MTHEFTKRFGLALLLDLVLSAIEAFFLAIPGGLLGRIIAAFAVSSLTFALVYFKETQKAERPPFGCVLILLWAVGFGFTFGTNYLLNFVSNAIPASPPSTPLPFVTATHTPFVKANKPSATPRPTYTLQPTYTPLPTYTPRPPHIVVVTPTFTPSPTLPYGYVKVCAEAPPSPFEVGRLGYICNNSKILLWSKPSVRSHVNGSIEPGTRFEVLGGPECGEQRVWWRIRLIEEHLPNLTGWMPETSRGGDEVYICPLP